MTRPGKRPTVTAIDGRTYRGIWPEAVKTPHEGPYIVALARQLGGVPEVTLPVGRADVATSTDVYEVEPVKSWRYGARQAFGYAGMTGMAANLALFGMAEYLSIYLQIRDRMPGLTLWRWHDGKWQRVTTRSTAGLKAKREAVPA